MLEKVRNEKEVKMVSHGLRHRRGRAGMSQRRGKGIGKAAFTV